MTFKKEEDRKASYIWCMCNNSSYCATRDTMNWKLESLNSKRQSQFFCVYLAFQLSKPATPTTERMMCNLIRRILTWLAIIAFSLYGVQSMLWCQKQISVMYTSKLVVASVQLVFFHSCVRSEFLTAVI